MEFISWELVFGLVTVIGTIEGIRRHQANRIEGINKDLQDHKLETAKTYASQAAVNAQFQSVASSINEVGKRMEDRLDGMNERLDRVIEANHKPSTRRSP